LGGRDDYQNIRPVCVEKERAGLATSPLLLDLSPSDTNYGAIFMAGSLQPLCPPELTALLTGLSAAKDTNNNKAKESKGKKGGSHDRFSSIEFVVNMKEAGSDLRERRYRPFSGRQQCEAADARM
jgi:hypothetical protein